MNVHIQTLPRAGNVRGLLRKNGWRIAEAGADAFDASHPAVSDEADARDRLAELGLLLSNRLHIDFPRTRTD